MQEDMILIGFELEYDLICPKLEKIKIIILMVCLYHFTPSSMERLADYSRACMIHRRSSKLGKMSTRFLLRQMRK